MLPIYFITFNILNRVYNKNHSYFIKIDNDANYLKMEELRIKNRKYLLKISK